MRRALTACVLAGLLLVACDSSPSTSSPGTSPSSATTNFSLEVASTDLYVGDRLRVQVGVFGSTDQGVELLTGGSIPLTLVAADGGDPIEGQAHYIPAPGTPSAKDPALDAAIAGARCLSAG